MNKIMKRLDEIKIDPSKENCFTSKYDITLEKIKKLDNTFHNISLKDINKKITMRSIKIIEDDNYLNIEMRTSKIFQILLSFLLIFTPGIMLYYSYLEPKFNLSFELFSSFALILASLFYLLLEKVNFGLDKAIFKDNKLQLSYEGKKNEIIFINSDTKFIIESKYYQKQVYQISLSDIIVFLFNEEELYVANYLAYKMNKYVLNQLQKH